MHLPAPVPIPTSADEAAAEPKPELDGHCPVPLGRGPKGGDYKSRMATLRRGAPAYRAEYKGKHYTMADAAAYTEFLATPWKYAELSLPAKLPPQGAPLDVAGLPLHGFMEQSSNLALQAALNELCALMPKYPTLDARSTALKFIAVHLKANNPRLRAPHLKHKFGSKLLDFTECCTITERLLEHETRRQAALKAGVAPPQTAEYDHLLQLWDSVKEKPLREFIE